MILLITTLLLFGECLGVIYRIPDEEYARMPPLNNLDDYDSCLQRSGGVYCSADVTLVSNTSSKLLDMIHEYSDHFPAHFNHTELFYGICVTSTCKKHYKNKTEDLRGTLEVCLNETIWNKYSLEARVSDDLYCDRHNESTNIDLGDIIVAVICIVIVLLNIVGSVSDVLCSSEKNIQGNRFLMCFSLKRNWKKLTSPASSDPRLERLRGIHGIRTISTALVITSHAVMPYYIAATNPHFVEKLYHYLPFRIILNGTIIMQTFLIMSGFLLTYHLQLEAESKDTKWTLVPKAILLRWLRLTPAYGVVLAVTATWLRHAGSGPYWQRYVTTESLDCRRDWWYFMLYINNYKDDSSCMLQNWYLAADTHLYILGLIVWFTCRKTGTRKVVLALLLLVGIVAPAAQVYVQDLEANVLLSPENARTIYDNDPTFHKLYKRSHANIPGYVIGLALGYLLYDWQKRGLDVQKYKKYFILYWALAPALLVPFAAGVVFYTDAPRASLITRMMYAAFAKPAFALIMACIIGGMVLKYEDLVRGVLEWKLWRCPGRIAYSVYLLHCMVIRPLAGQQKTTVDASLLMMLNTITSTTALTFGVGVPFWFLVEAPLVNLSKLCFSSWQTNISEPKMSEPKTSEPKIANP